MLPEINMTPKDWEFITPVSHPDVSAEPNLILPPASRDRPSPSPGAGEQGFSTHIHPRAAGPSPAQLRPGYTGRSSHPNLSGLSQSRFKSWLLPLPFLMTLGRFSTFSEPQFLHR